VRSRVLLGVGGWLLGAGAATAGSLYAIAQLGQGLIEQRTNQVSVAMVNAALAQDGAEPAANPQPNPSPTTSPNATHSPAKPRSRNTHQVAPPATYSSKALTSAGGWAAATCGPDGARLLYESPAQGFEVFHVVPGPSAIASVTFASSSVGVSIKVTCDTSGVPVGRVTKFQRGAWGPHHDE
jgi:hypothetical protein